MGTKLSTISRGRGHTLIVDAICRKKYEEDKRSDKDLRKIHNYLCCEHVAYGKYQNHIKVFFYNPRDGKFDVPEKSPPEISRGAWLLAKDII